MNEILKKYWEGKFSLGQSYWVGAILAPIVLSIPLIIVGSSVDNFSDGGEMLAIAYWVFVFFANMFLLIGAFKSASNYVKQNREKKKNTLWGILAQILLALGIFAVVGQYIITITS